MSTTTERMAAIVRAHPAHLYTYSPSNATADDRYVFTDRTCRGLSAAYLHASELPVTTPAGYTYKAELYCPEHIESAMDTRKGGDFDGWALDPSLPRIGAERNLDEIAHAFGIDREDEHTFNSDDFPKRVTEEQLDGDERCGICDSPLVSES